MADESKKGILGHLPPPPRAALNNSVIAMEQAYRQRKGLPLLTDDDIAALKAGEPMPWERGDGAPAAPASTPAQAAAAPPAAAPPAAPPPAAPAATAGGISAEVAKWVAEGKKWSKSAIAAEQARRGRKGLPALTDAEASALLGEPVETSAPPAAAAAPAAAVAPAAPAAPSGPISAEVAKWVAEGKKWSKSSIAAEQARRGRKGLPPLTDSEVTALLGEPAAAAAPPVAAPVVAAKPAAAAPRTPAVAASAAASVARGGESTKYVGTPAVGTSKAAAAGGVASVGPEDNEINQSRRRFTWAAFAAFMTAWFIAFFRFFLPRTLFEPATSFKIGYPADFGLGVDTKFQQKYRIWVDRTPDRIFVIYARCTHLGCTPDWKPAENKFKCPCHGSGYDSEGVNFEGPAPRPMDRAKVEIAPDGQILVDVSKLYQWPKGQPSQFNDPGAFLPT
jgi:cytochrome b6-f complex iron-sulfur subunit